MLKEIDLTQKPKSVPSKCEAEPYDIFGIAEWRDNPRFLGESY